MAVAEYVRKGDFCLHVDSKDHTYPYVCASMLIGKLRPRTYARHSRSVKSSPTMAECGRVDSTTSGHTMDKSITLPPDEIFRNLENAKRFAIDIGMWEYKCFLNLFIRFCFNEV